MTDECLELAKSMGNFFHPLWLCANCGLWKYCWTPNCAGPHTKDNMKSILFAQSSVVDLSERENNLREILENLKKMEEAMNSLKSSSNVAEATHGDVTRLPPHGVEERNTDVALVPSKENDLSEQPVVPDNPHAARGHEQPSSELPDTGTKNAQMASNSNISDILPFPKANIHEFLEAVQKDGPDPGQTKGHDQQAGPSQLDDENDKVLKDLEDISRNADESDVSNDFLAYFSDNETESEEHTSDAINEQFVPNM